MTSFWISNHLTLVTLATIIFVFNLPQSHGNSPFTLPILKDTRGTQYYTSLLLGTPSFRVTISIDLSNPWSWFTCNSVGNNETIYEPVPNSSTYHPVRCVNATCAAYDSFFCYDCNYQTCGLAKGQTCGAEPYGPYFYTHEVQGHLIGPLITDVVTIYKSNTAPLVKTQLSNFPFTCGYISVLKGLSKYTKGVLSLARKNSALPSLIAKTFNVPRKFALCLPSSSSSGINGALYFGGGPYSLPPNKNDLSKSFSTTPLVVNPVDIGVTFYKGKSSVDYFINVKSILIDGTPIKIDSTLLTINKNGTGGTKLSTINGYTILHTNIYNSVVEAFTTRAAAVNIARVGPVSSFATCFSSTNIVGSKTGPRVPVIELVLDGGGKWSIYGANSMVKVSNNVRCLAFMDGGVSAKTAIVIGGKQMEDNLIEFDLESSRWHDAGTYDVNTKTGGPNGSIKYELSHNANRGLQIAIDFCEQVKAKHLKITYADLYQLAGVVAVEMSGGPTIDFVPGRMDCLDPTSEGRLPRVSHLEGQITLVSCYGMSWKPYLKQKSVLLTDFNDLGFFHICGKLETKTAVLQITT